MKGNFFKLSAGGAAFALASAGLLSAPVAFADDEAASPIVTTDVSEFSSALGVAATEDSGDGDTVDASTTEGGDTSTDDASSAPSDGATDDTSSDSTDDASDSTDDATGDDDGDDDGDDGDGIGEIPNPLDFANIAQDPDDYALPTAASRFGRVGEMVIGAPEAGGNGAGVIASGLESYYNQKVTWGQCEPFGQDGENGKYLCAYVIVPVDYSNPNGQRAAIALRRLPSTGEHKGSIFLDPGGPGSGGMGLADQGASEFTGKLNENFDFIGFDPRGTGASLPQIRCESNAAMDVQREGADGLKGDDLDKILEYNTNQCYQNTGKGFKNFDSTNYIANIGTRNVVKDLDILRSVVGDEKLNYIGYSYGTSIGYQYMMAFKSNARALLLDGVVNPFENNPVLKMKYAKYFPKQSGSAVVAQRQGFQGTFEQFAKKCATEGFTLQGKKFPCALGTSADSLDQLQAKYLEIVRSAYNSPAYTYEADGRHVSWADVNQGAIQAMYSDSLWGYLNYGLLEMSLLHSADMMMRLADWYMGRDDEGHYEQSQAAFRTISCVDSHEDSDDREATAREALEVYAAAPFTDPGKNADGSQREAEPSYGWCHYYKSHGDLPTGVEVNAAPNVLVLSTTHDSATPYPNGVVAAEGLSGTLLTVAGARHTSYGSSECANEIVNNYFMTGAVPADGTESGPERETKDIYSNVIQGHECRINSFVKPSAVTRNLGQVTQGGEITFTATGAVVGEKVTFTVHSEPTSAGSAVANDEGVATLTWSIPADFEAGMHTVEAAFGDRATATSMEFEVVASAPTEQPAPEPSPEPSPEASPQSSPQVSTGGDALVVSQPKAKATKVKKLSYTGANAVAGFSAAFLLIAVGGIGLAMRRREN